MVLNASVVPLNALIAGSNMEPSTKSEPVNWSTADALLHDDYRYCRYFLTADLTIVHICDRTATWKQLSVMSAAESTISGMEMLILFSTQHINVLVWMFIYLSQKERNHWEETALEVLFQRFSKERWVKNEHRLQERNGDFIYPLMVFKYLPHGFPFWSYALPIVLHLESRFS